MIHEKTAKVNYRPFYSLFRRLANKTISRSLFVLEWERAQKEQGIKVKVGV